MAGSKSPTGSATRSDESSPATRGVMPFVLAIAASAALAAGWWVPGTAACVVAGWIGTLLLVILYRNDRSPYLAPYVAGLAAYPLGFYWLYGTIKDFGGFPAVAAGAIFALFVAVAALQYPIAAWIYRNLPPALDRVSLRLAVAWTVSELVSIRIFPWQLGHTQLAFTWFAQGASLAGTLLLSFVMVGCAEAVVSMVRRSAPLVTASLPLFLLAGICTYGYGVEQWFRTTEVPRRKIALIQANISITEKHDVKSFAQNTERYVRLSNEIPAEGTLIVWPESVLQEWFHAKTGNVMNDPRIPFIGKGSAMLVGALTFESRTRYFNSAVAIYPSGEIPYPYHKRILMPFGEYTPLGSMLPWLKAINATAADFTPGEQSVVFPIPLADAAPTMTAPLICYEDVIPSLAREATANGAQLLVNMTNDAWFGDTAAPHEHHLIAAFRAIENRRYLLRSTNSGLTAVVNPIGETEASLRTFSDGVLQREVGLYDQKTIYTEYLGEQPWWLLSIVAGLLVLHSHYRARRLRTVNS